MMPSPHPTDRTLAGLLDGRLSGQVAADVRAHVRECARCQFRLGAADAGVVRSPDAAVDAGPIAIPTAAPRDDTVKSPLDERLVGLDELSERFADLANAAWAPRPAVVLAAAVTFDYDTLVRAGLPFNRALAIVRGASPTAAEADLIES